MIPMVWDAFAIHLLQTYSPVSAYITAGRQWELTGRWFYFYWPSKVALTRAINTWKLTGSVIPQLRMSPDRIPTFREQTPLPKFAVPAIYRVIIAIGCTAQPRFSRRMRTIHMSSVVD